MADTASFSIGQIVQHRLFEYRGLIYDVDPTFQLTDEWYEQVARSRPPKDAPWYHVLPDGAQHMTYVAERNLDEDVSLEPVCHPLVEALFERGNDGSYRRLTRTH
jgi:heat shock protein HspQ